MERLLRPLAWFSIVMLLAGLAPVTAWAQAADSFDIPGFAPIGPDATPGYLVTGELAEGVPSGAHLTVERIALAIGDGIPVLDAGQILVVESGELSLTDDLGLEATLDAGTQLFVATAGYRDLTAKTDARILRAFIAVSDLSKAAATPVPADQPNTETIFDQKLEAFDPGAMLFVAEVELAGNGGSLGEQSYNGATGIIGDGAPLTVERPGHVPSRLPEGQDLFFPAGTVATVINEATPMATVLIAGIVVPASPEDAPSATATPESGSSAPSSGNGQPSRPTTRDDQSEQPSSLEGYLPDDSDATAAGFLPITTEPTANVADSVFNGLANEPNDGGWVTGLARVYLPQGEWGDLNAALVSVDQFDSVASASDAIGLFAIGAAVIAEPFDPPASATADQVVGFTMDVPEQEFTGTFIMAQYGDVIVTTVAIAPLNGDSEPAGAALWEVVDAANS